MKSIVLKITWQSCSKCGVPFGLSKRFDEQRQKDHQWYHCPNGHQLRYAPAENDDAGPELPENQKLRRKLLTARHHIDQLEAKVADLEMRPLLPASSGQVACDDQPQQQMTQCRCPICGKTYNSSGWLARHFKKVHGGVKRK